MTSEVGRSAQHTGLTARLGAWWQDFAEAERESLPLWLPVALGCGIAAWFALPWEAWRLGLAAVLAGIGVAGLLLGWRPLGVAALLALAGMAAAEWRCRTMDHAVLSGERFAVFTARVEQVDQRAGRGDVRLWLAPVTGQGLPQRVRVTLRGQQAEPPLPVAGRQVRVRAWLGPPAGPVLPGGMDSARAAWFQGLGASGFALARPEPLGDQAEAPVMMRLRAALQQRVTARMPGEAGAVAAAFITGDQGAIPPVTAQVMRDAGLAHLLSISGLHIAVVVGGVVWLLRRLLALSPWLALHWPVRIIAMAGGAAAGVGYTLLAGAEVPTVRAIIAALVVLVGMVLGREAFSLRLLAVAAFAILIVRPEALLGASFQLSFAAVIAIVALYESRLGQWLNRRDEDDHPMHRLLRAGAALLATGVVAELALTPIGLFHFGRGGTYGALANLVAIPWSSFVIMPALGLGLVGEALDLPLLWQPAGWAVAKLIALADWVATQPGAVATSAAVPATAFALLVAGGLWLALWRSRARWAGAAPMLAGALLAATATPPDLLVSADGRHVALRLPDGRLAFSRERAGRFLAERWTEALGSAADSAVWLGAVPGAACSRDACVAVVMRGGRRWRLLATISPDFIERTRFAPACAAADIVVSDRRLPRWCVPRWLKLDRTALAASGAVSIRLNPPHIVSVADSAGDHPWAPSPPDPRRRPDGGG